MKKAIILASVLAIACLIVLSILSTKENSEGQMAEGTTILVGDTTPLVKRDDFVICKGRSVDMSKAFFRLNDSLKKLVIPENELSLAIVSGDSVTRKKFRLTASKSKSGSTVLKQCWTTRNLCQQFTVVVPPPDAGCSM